MREKRRVRALACGYEISDKGAMTLNKDVGKNIKIPYYSWLIEDPDRKILVDTAVSLCWKEVHPKVLRDAYPPHLAHHEHIDVLLRDLGYDTKDIGLVINTHLHYDHCGNNNMFRKAQFIVNERELKHARRPGWWDAAGYVKALFDISPLKYMTIRGNYRVAKGIEIIPTIGHSLGHQSVVIQLESTGPLVLVGDAIYLRENLETPILPGIYWNAEEYAKSMEKIKQLAFTENATLLFSHSSEYRTPNGWKKLKKRIETFD